MTKSKLGLTAARGTLLSIALRLASFILSQATVRFVSAAALGKASVPLELLLGTALFVSREGFRLALTKESGKKSDADAKDGRRTEQRMINVSWLSVPLGAIISMIAMYMHLSTCNHNIAIKSESEGVTKSEYELLDYKMAGVLYCFASFIESLSEPLVIRCLQQMDVTTKAKAEGVALVMKSVSCFGCLYILSSNWAVSAFGISQLVYGITFTTIMYRHGRSIEGGIQWPKRVTESTTINPYKSKSGIRQSFTQSFDYQQLHLVLVFTLQGLFKHALTEADKIVLSALAGSYDQGIYAIASSYGGLAARLLLQPIEENARLLFSRQGALMEQDKESDSKSTTNAATSKQLVEMQNTYSFLLRTVCLIGLLFATIATNYTSILLRLLAGYRWGSNSKAISALSAFCVYTAFLSLNGITEAFVYGVARSGKDIGQLSIVHAVVGVIFALIAPGLVAKFQHGLVAANCICMALRSAYSLYFAWGYFANGKRNSSSIRLMFRAVPHPLVVIAFAVSFAATRASRDHFYDETLEGQTWMLASLKHVGVGIVCACGTFAVTLRKEGDIRQAIKGMLQKVSHVALYVGISKFVMD